jgi:hypothetical protein
MEGSTPSSFQDAELASQAAAALNLKARRDSEQDVEEADDSLVVLTWTMSQARAASEGMKTFVHSNLEEHPELRKYMDPSLSHVEYLDSETLLENMTFSARSKQTTLLQHGFTSAPETSGG